MPDRSRWDVEELRAEHDRSAFSRGYGSLDEFLIRYAGQNERSGICRTFVAVCVGERLVRGYYSIVAGAVSFVSVPESEWRKQDIHAPARRGRAGNPPAARAPGCRDKIHVMSEPCHHTRASPELTDWVQEIVIARARELGLTAYAIAKRTDGRVSEDHVKNYIERRASMGSHKLQHVLKALDLVITPA